MAEKEKSIPVFVKLEEYKDALNLVEVIRAKLDETKETINHINQLKIEEDSEIESWKESVINVEKKLEQIDQILLEPRF